ncbi:TonB-dependent receptor domain-containing protein [Cognatiluteimonas weifangensis]|uniref:TonB-dependent receptor n=1 Tax=Cognatiluteimonas weifangensis TaxID=2303539 RepID=A0A372DIK6_9GAMM|nr:TonB-dependent receptor [Luteimonas weifangensis]RFP59411.1 TonB-dependent receptor [Luteimonas weifangensis]
MPSRPLRPAPLALALVLALAAPLAWAADPPAQTDPRHAEPKTLDTVEVTATPLPDTAESLAQPVEVLAGQRLDAAKASSLGETVGRLPGVQSSYFGPGVGRPIVRGMDGARVQVLSGGLGSGDVSTVSADHAVTIEPFLADQIEVLKGPATLLYGSGAIGGAVNVVDGRIPEAQPVQPLQGRAELRAGTVNDARSGMLRLDGGAGDFAFHFDALHRETGDYEIPGFAESARLLAEEGETPDPDEAGVLPGSGLRTDGAALGMSWIGSRGFLGAGYSLYSTRYGIPGHAHGEEHDEHAEEGHDERGAAEGVRVVMDQRRSEVRGGLDALGPFQTLRVKLARTAYTHTELEDGAVGTVFDNDSTEGRVELVHRPLAGFEGALGLQWSQRDFAAVGAEAFVPGSESRDIGAFWIGNRDFGPLGLQLGVRHDRNRIDVDDALAIGPDREFDTTSASASLEWELGEDLHVALGLDRAQRSPTAEELYSNGLHVATGSVEQGDPALDPETANRAELGAHWHLGPLTLRAAVYRVAYDDFIYLARTGLVEEDLPVQQWRQADARFTGGEAELEWALADNTSGRWDLRLFGDAVRAKLVDGGNLPRIAPARLGGELRWERDALRASLGATRYMEQDRVAEFETVTPGYTLVDAHFAWHSDTRGGNAWELFVDGRNLLDEEARPHTSFLKDLAPLPGRGIEAGVRMFF